MDSTFFIIAFMAFSRRVVLYRLYSLRFATFIRIANLPSGGILPNLPATYNHPGFCLCNSSVVAVFLACLPEPVSVCCRRPAAHSPCRRHGLKRIINIVWQLFQFDAYKSFNRSDARVVILQCPGDPWRETCGHYIKFSEPGIFTLNNLRPFVGVYSAICQSEHGDVILLGQCLPKISHTLCN